MNRIAMRDPTSTERHPPAFAVAIILVFLLAAVAYGGRADKAGTAAAQELLIPVGGDAIAMGGSSLSIVTGIDALYWNPAGLVRSPDETDATFSHMSYFAGIGVDYAAVSTKIPNIASIGLAVKSLSFGQIPVTTEDYPDGNGQFASPSYVVVSGALSRLITDHIAFGLTGNIIFESMDKVSATGVAFSFGLQYNGLGGVEGLSFGVTVDNIGPPMTYDGDGLLRVGQVDNVLRPETTYKIQAASDDLPSMICIGLGYTMPLSDREQVQLTTTFQNNDYSDDEYKFGAEFVYDRIVSFRAGYSMSAGSESDYIYGFSGGIGVAVRFQGINLAVDYAYRAASYFSGNNVLSLNLGF